MRGGTYFQEMNGWPVIVRLAGERVGNTLRNSFFSLVSEVSRWIPRRRRCILESTATIVTKVEMMKMWWRESREGINFNFSAMRF
jgi:hypothetical protein